MRSYCTLFDSAGYLHQGLALYDSLQKHSVEPFQLHVLAMDAECYRILTELALPGVRVMDLGTFELLRPAVAECRANRTWQEYCWTVASNFAELLMDRLALPDLTYLDSDLFFFSSPSPVFDEIGERSIGICPHRFAAKDWERLSGNGTFNVGLVHFKNTEMGRECLSTWAANVREWCYNRVEGEHACGDQKYLDTWESDYGPHLCVIENIGVDAGPWNIGQYRVTPGPHLNGYPLVCYHFHEYRHHERLTNWPLRPEFRKLIYEPYVQAVEEVKARIGGLEAGVPR
jgi:hypothetical protein